MFKFSIQKYAGLLLIVLAAAAGCKAPALTTATENRSVPASFGNNQDTTNMAALPWRSFFTDKNLVGADRYCVNEQPGATDHIAGN